MALPINAVQAYGPKIKMGLTASTKELITLVSGRTGLNKGDIQQVISELHEAIVFFHNAGRPVKIEGLGIFSPSMNLDGKISVSIRIDSSIKSDLNKDREFEGQLINGDSKGKTMEELITRWNEEHPDDLIA